MAENMVIYDQVAEVPATAQRTIGAGRLKGFTDINPMWRISALTKTFGPCGLGWWYEITDKHLEAAPNGEVKAFVDINLFYIWNGKESKAIPGTGGSAFISNEKSGTYVSDEAYKMALTDAISVAAKALGVGADVYWKDGRSKYNSVKPDEPKPQAKALEPDAMKLILPIYICEECHATIHAMRSKGKVFSEQELADRSMKAFGQVLCVDCAKKRGNANAAEHT